MEEEGLVEVVEEKGVMEVVDGGGEGGGGEISFLLTKEIAPKNVHVKHHALASMPNNSSIRIDINTRLDSHHYSS